MIKGIYKIVNQVNKNCYIGSSKNIGHRWSIHKSNLNKNKHHCVYLQRAFNKYGAEVFSLQIIEETNDLFSREQYWINKLNPSYNIGGVGGGDNISNHPNNAKIRKKISETTKGRKGTKLFGNKNSNWKGGKKLCNICNIEMLRKNKSGFCKKHYLKTGKNNPFYGKKHTKKAKNKISLANLGRTPPNIKKIMIENKIFKSLTEAAKEFNITVGAIHYRINSSNFIDYNYHPPIKFEFTV